MNPVKCRSCGRAGLPVRPGTLPNRATPVYPVAHVVNETFHDMVIVRPCFQGGSRAEAMAITDTNTASITIVHTENMEAEWEL